MPPARSTLFPAGAAHKPSPARRVPRAWRVAGAALAGLALAQGGCFFSNDGLSPPSEAFYYPTGVVVSPGRTTLYVADSDFDLQFNGGTVQVLDLQAIRAKLGVMLPGIVNAQPGALRAVCNGILMSATSAGATGAACTAPSDCASGDCVIGSDGVHGSCATCTLDSDCPGGGRCQVARCKSDGATLCNTKLDCPLKASDTCEPTSTEEHVCVLNLVYNQNPHAGDVLADSAPVQGLRHHRRVRLRARCSRSTPRAGPGRGSSCRCAATRRSPGSTSPTIAPGAPAEAGAFRLDCGAAARRQPALQRRPPHGRRPLRELPRPEPPGRAGGARRLRRRHQIVIRPQHRREPRHRPLDDPGRRRPARRATPTPAARRSPARSSSYYLSAPVANGPSEVAHVPAPALAAVLAANASADPTLQSFSYQHGFLVTYSSPRRSTSSAPTSTTRPAPAPRAPSSPGPRRPPVTVNADGKDSRGMVDRSRPRGRRARPAATATPPA